MKLRDYQSESIKSAYNYFRNSRGSPLIVLPTGAGKSLVLAGLCHDLVANYPGMRLVVLSHSIELVEQDYKKLKEYWTKAPAGIYSASLGKKQVHHDITFATIQSVYKKAEILGHRDLVCIDEAHLLSRKTDGMYNRLIDRLKLINPDLRLLGLTASPFRLDSGYLYEGDDALFDGVCYDAKLRDLVEQKYLTPIVSKAPELQADLRGVKVTAGEFNGSQMEKEFCRISEEAISDAIPRLVGRKAVMWFCSGIRHADITRDLLLSIGEVAESVSSKTPKSERRERLEGFKVGAFRHICSMALITTGYDAPITDAICMLRATMSPGLYLQIAGRGLRLHPDKENCLFLDYGTNVERHGALTHIAPPIPRKKGQRSKDEEGQKPTVRICQICRTANPLEAAECVECGSALVVERTVSGKIVDKASDAPMMLTDAEFHESLTSWVDVERIHYMRHRKEGKPDSMRVEYQCGLMVYKEWVCFDHGGYAATKAMQWWKKRDWDGQTDTPDNTREAIELSDLIRTPYRIRIRKKEKLFEVIDYDFEPAPQTVLAIGA